MPDAMTIRAQQDALVSLAPGPIDVPEEAAQRELLRGRHTMMELERRSASAITTALAAPSALRDQLGLDPDPSPAAVVDPRLPASNSRVLRWSPRCVVRAEWRADETEAATVQRPDLAIDRHLQRKGLTAALAVLRSDRPHNGLSRSPQRSMRQALETLLPAAQIDPLSADHDDEAERPTAFSAHAHGFER